MLDRVAALSLARLWPELAQHGAASVYGPTARPVASFAALRLAQVVTLHAAGAQHGAFAPSPLRELVL